VTGISKVTRQKQVIKIFESLAWAGREVGGNGSRQGLTNATDKQVPYKGYIWEYFDQNKLSVHCTYTM